MSKSAGTELRSAFASQISKFDKEQRSIGIRNKKLPFGKSTSSVDILKDLAQLWVKADQNDQHWMKDFLELLIEYSLGHLESDKASHDLQLALKRFVN